MSLAGFALLLAVVTAIAFFVPCAMARWGWEGRQRPGCALAFASLLGLMLCSEAAKDDGEAGQQLLLWLVVVACIASSTVGLWLANRADAGERHFSKPIAPDRAELIEGVFGLTTVDMRFLRFDGEQFWFGLSAKPYSSFTYEQLQSTDAVEVQDPDLPHHAQYAYTRIDGGPDRRYGYNPVTRYSRRYVFRSVGSEERTIIAYSYPGADVDRADQIAKRFTHFLQCASAIQIDRIVIEFSRAQSRLRLAEGRLKATRAQSEEAERVLALAKHLPPDVLSTDKHVQASILTASTGQEKANLAWRSLTEEVTSARARVAEVLRAAKERAAPYEHLGTVKLYQQGHRR